ncbi:beta-lactamase family protein [Spirosoma sp. BT702]|uniref:Beta-lactamase family protein n=1 Tax=Spirosoma profusum TaxID=2771354 RepID=A0A927ANY0_9BACT|nr:serine hydrolase domain-containing protein [Spirosoma profusum]MBD2702839.1 beta-lactamase family protein [Spirosoma profusum]
MKYILSLAYFLLNFQLAPLAQTKQDKRLLNQVDELLTEKYNPNTPACVVLVARKGQIIYQKAVGMANIELGVPSRTDMVFRIGSITKQFTAVALLQLVEQGKISLQDSLQKFVPVFSNKGRITIENLLTHTSGIVDYQVLDFHIPNAIRIDFPVKQLIDSLAKLPLIFAPNSKYGYSNSNYLLLGQIIERVSGMSYQTYLQEHILKRAGLFNTYYDSPTQLIKNRVNGYKNGQNGYANIDYLSMNQVFSAGALLSTVGDLFQWHQALYANKLLKKESLEKAFTPFKLAEGRLSEYGYGWFIRDWKGSPSIGHGGAIDGFRSMEMYLPEQDLYIAALMNAEDDSFFSFSETILDKLTSQERSSAYKDLTLSDDVLNRYVGKYVYVADSTESLRVYKEGDRLYCDLSNQSGMHMGLYAQSATLFYLPVIRQKPTTIEFVVEGTQVRSAYWSQQKRAEFRKTK